MRRINLICKFLTFGKRRISGRGGSGHISSCHRGGGFKRRHRVLDLFRVWDQPAIVKRLEYDPNRNASIALIRYYNEVLSYIIAPRDLSVDDIIRSHHYWLKYAPGNRSRLGNFNSGTFVHNLELKPLCGGQYMRSCGAVAQILKKYGNNFVAVKLNTGEQRLIASDCKATIGVPAQLFANYALTNYGSAGRIRRFGYRSVVRGVAMNPVDHPHGGAGGRLDRSPWGWLTKGPRTTRMRQNWRVLHTRRALAERKIKK